MTSPTVFTIGHSNHRLEKLVDLLRMHSVNAIADVRSSPYSRSSPAFNRESLQDDLKSSGIAYVYLGNELGGRPADPSCYERGQVQYDRVAKTSLFKKGLRRVFKGVQLYRLALLCAEKEPLVCHRTLLVGHELVALSVPVVHIHADGALESHASAMARLIRMLGLSDKDLYRTREELVADACTLQAKRVAYVDQEMSKKASA